MPLLFNTKYHLLFMHNNLSRSIGVNVGKVTLVPFTVAVVAVDEGNNPMPTPMRAQGEGAEGLRSFHYRGASGSRGALGWVFCVGHRWHMPFPAC